MAYAAPKGLSWSVNNPCNISCENDALGAASVPIPGFGQVALLISSVVAGCLIIYDVAEGVQAASRTGLYHMFQFYQKEISKSEVPLLNKYCRELYSHQIAEGARDLFDNIKDIGEDTFLEGIILEDDSYKWQGLSWRAAVPLYLKGYSVDTIRSMVILPQSIPTELTQRVRDSDFKAIKIIQSVDDIITYYKEMSEPETQNETMASGRQKLDIAKALANGDFIPCEGHDEELEIEENGRSRVISFDHLYFRAPVSVNGVDWDELNEQSNKITQGIRYV